MQYQLLALDVDGTILDPEGQIRPVVQRAVAEVQARGYTSCSAPVDAFARRCPWPSP